MENNCVLCNSPISQTGECPNCGRFLGEYTVLVMFSTAYYDMIVTPKYLIFTKGGQVNMGRMAAVFAGGLVGEAIYNSKHSKSKFKSFGMIDINSIQEASFIMPESKISAPAFVLKFKNGKDPYLGVYEAAGKKHTHALIDLFRSINVNVQIYSIKSLKEIKALNPIADKKTLGLTVSRSAAQVIKPFNKMIVID